MSDSFRNAAFIAESELRRLREFDARFMTAQLTDLSLKSVVGVTLTASPTGKHELRLFDELTAHIVAYSFA
jgi:hypothetical protein